MNCQYERDGSDLLADMPERLVRWYQLRGLPESAYRVLPDAEQPGVKIELTG